MVDDNKAVTILIGDVVEYAEAFGYDDDLARAGAAADRASQEDAFRMYHVGCSENTHQAQLQGLELFTTFLAEAGVKREASDLYYDGESWRGMSHGLLKGFRTWLVNAGYRIGTVNHRLAIIRQYCKLAHAAGVIPDGEYELLMTVKGFNAKVGRNTTAIANVRVPPPARVQKRPCPRWCSLARRSS